ncbi:MAG: MFS transporter [Candidatus Dormibacteria bacterium]
MGSAIVFLDSTVVNVALPAIGRELPRLRVGVLEGQAYVYNAYLLTLSALLILAGALSDYYGRRRMFALGLVGFGGASGLCGLAPNMEILVVARVIQGAFGALLVPGSLSLLRVNFEGEEQGRAFGIWAGASALTTIAGPFLGGVLVDTVSWRAAFLINLPLVGLALYALLRHVPESRDLGSGGHFDWLGAAVTAVGIGGLAFGVIYGGQRQWQDPTAFVLILVGTVACVAFPFLMRANPYPLVPLHLFRSRNFSVTNASTFLIYGALYVGFLAIGLFLQGTLGYTAAAAGIAGVPGSLLLALFSSRAGRLAGRVGPRWFMTVGPVLMALGLLWLVRLPAGSSPWLLRPQDPASYLPSHGYLFDVLPAFVVFGAGLALLVAPLTTALMTSVDASHSGVASAINNAISRVGPQLAGAMVFAAITASFYGAIARRVPSSTLDVTRASVRAAISPLTQPTHAVIVAQHLGNGVAAVIRDASATSLHVAVVISAALLLLGAAVNGFGITDPRERP